MAVPGTSTETDWVTGYFAAVDSLDVGAVVAQFTEDASVTLGNAPTAVGREQVTGAVGGLTTAVSAIRHEIHRTWTTGPDAAATEMTVHATSPGGTTVAVPCASFFERAVDGRIAAMRVYVDLSPLFAAPGAEAAAVG